jgi:hypothetical protein
MKTGRKLPHDHLWLVHHEEVVSFLSIVKCKNTISFYNFKICNEFASISFKLDKITVKNILLSLLVLVMNKNYAASERRSGNFTSYKHVSI